MFDIQAQKQIAIQHAHNTTGDFTTCFAGTGFGENKVNPSSEGITFFRPQGMRTADQQIGAFDALNTILSNVGGLDTLVVFGDTMGSNIQDGITIAKGVKVINPEIETILLSLQPSDVLRHKSEIFDSEIDDSIAEEISERRIEFIASKNETVFEARFDSDKSFADTLTNHFIPATHFDIVISKFMSWPETFREIAGLPNKSGKSAKDWSWTSSAQEAYYEQLPDLEEWETLVSRSASGNDWDNFKKSLLRKSI